MTSLSFFDEQENGLLYIGFNQDQGCFACGTRSGFLIFNVNPFTQTFHREFTSGGLGIVEMLFRSNLLGLVGGGQNPRYPPNKVMIWDDHQNRRIGELSFKSNVLAVKLRRDCVVVVLETKIFVYNFADLKLMHTIPTTQNKKGLVAVCPDSSNLVLACPSNSRGCVRVELYTLRKSIAITAHESELAQIALNMDGTRVATASDRGTLIRVFDTQTGQQLQELRRGSDPAVINSICFSHNSTFLASTSDKGTAHIWVLHPENTERMSEDTRQSSADVTNRRSGFSIFRTLLPQRSSNYINSEWSFAQFHGIDPRSICAFASATTLAIVSADGSFSLVDFEVGGECERVSSSKFLRSNEIEVGNFDEETKAGNQSIDSITERKSNQRK